MTNPVCPHCGDYADHPDALACPTCSYWPLRVPTAQERADHRKPTGPRLHDRKGTMKLRTTTLVAALALATPAAAAVTVTAPVRTPGPSYASWVMTSTVTADEPVTVAMWQTVFRIGPDGERTRLTATLPAGTHRVGVPCYSTLATYSWWVTATGAAGTVTSPRTAVKCR